MFLLGPHAANHHAFYVEIGSQEDEVGVRAGRDYAFLSRDAEAMRRADRRHADGFNRGHAKAYDVTHGAIKRQRTAGEFSVGIARDAVAHRDIECSQAIISIRHSRRGNSIADENHAIGAL